MTAGTWIGLISDVHGEVDQLERIRAR